jgi:hypothetical protein
MLYWGEKRRMQPTKQIRLYWLTAESGKRMLSGQKKRKHAEQTNHATSGNGLQVKIETSQTGVCPKIRAEGIMGDIPVGSRG